MDINELQIPKKLSDLLRLNGYNTLYPPQEEAIKAGALDGKNLVIATPTASGKTLIALLAAGKTISEGLGKVVYLTPLKALANEKYNEFKILTSLNKINEKKIKVSISTGDYNSSNKHLRMADILILTNEKFDSILRQGVKWINSISLFIIDEVHIIGDDYRGPTLEIILTKILTYLKSQILALSATIKNSREMAKWLSAALIDNKWRPINLIEGVYEYGEIQFSNGLIRNIETTNRGSVIDVAIDAVKTGGQSLIFAETRKMAISFALKASEITSNFLTKKELKEVKQISKNILSSGTQTKISKILSKVIEKGAAFHHAGLTNKHRTIIEDSFKQGFIKILSATPTLASGVNLPARRVIISSTSRFNSKFGRKEISVLEYKQMCGRAGRPKYDKNGETIIILSSKNDTDYILSKYVKGEPEPIRSQLYNEYSLRNHILATIASVPKITKEEIFNLINKSFLAIQCKKNDIKLWIKRTFDFLIKEDFVQKLNNDYIATDFGRKVSTLYIDLVTGVKFKNVLNVPYSDKINFLTFIYWIVSTPDFAPKFPIRNKDIDEAMIFINSYKNKFTFKDYTSEFNFYGEFVENFRNFLVLYGWIDEWSENKIFEKLSVEPGDLYRAIETAEWLAYSLFELSKLFKRNDLLVDTRILIQRIKYGIKPELIPLIKLEGIGRVRARSLYNYGFKSLNDLFLASEEKIAQVPKIGSTLAINIKKQIQKFYYKNQLEFI